MVYVITQVAVLLIVLLELAMLGRSICSWLPLEEDNPIETFLIGITEPLIYPLRVLFDRLNWFVGMPIDMPAMVTFLILTFLLFFLT